MLHKISDVIDASDDSASGFGLAAKSYSAGANNLAGVDLTKYQGGFRYTISVGTVGASGTVDAKIQDSADNSSFADLGTPIAITQITAAGMVNLDVRVRQIPRRYVRLVVTVATAACVVCVIFNGQKRVL